MTDVPSPSELSRLASVVARLGAGSLRLVSGTTAADVAAELSTGSVDDDVVVSWVRFRPTASVDRLIGDVAATLRGARPEPGRRHFLPEVVRSVVRLAQPSRLVLLLEGPPAAERAFAVATLHVAEVLARHGAAVALFVDRVASDGDPYFRAGHGALSLGRRSRAASGSSLPATTQVVLEEVEPEPDLVNVVPGVGAPHPMSVVEAKLAKALAQDAELGGLFEFNRRVETVLGSKPCVDLLWPGGKVVVEIDGAEHAERIRYAADRRRDYDLLVSGYLVARFLNHEVKDDVELVLARIRKIVSLRKAVA